MSSIVELVKIRYLKPLEALKEDGLGKGLLSFAAVVVSTFSDFFDTVLEILQVPPELVILLIIAIILDWFTGIQSAKRNDVYIRSLGLRQSWVKILEYAAGLIVLTGIANVFGTTEIKGWVGDSLRMLKNIHWMGYFYATFTEFKSIAENIQGQEGRFAKIIELIDDKIFGQKDDDKVR